MFRTLTLLAALTLAPALQAHELTVGDLQIIHPHIPQPAFNAMTAGGYMAITNTGTEADRLIGIETEIAKKVGLHESRVDASGAATMPEVEALEIPAGETVSLERGGNHVMFMGLGGPLTEAQMVKAVLIFEKAGRVEMEFMVDPPVTGEDQSGDGEHSGHGTEP